MQYILVHLLYGVNIRIVWVNKPFKPLFAILFGIVTIPKVPDICTWMLLPLAPCHILVVPDSEDVRMHSKCLSSTSCSIISVGDIEPGFGVKVKLSKVNYSNKLNIKGKGNIERKIWKNNVYSFSPNWQILFIVIFLITSGAVNFELLLRIFFWETANIGFWQVDWQVNWAASLTMCMETQLVLLMVARKCLSNASNLKKVKRYLVCGKY